jgi:hypothetical protein
MVGDILVLSIGTGEVADISSVDEIVVIGTIGLA